MFAFDTPPGEKGSRAPTRLARARGLGPALLARAAALVFLVWCLSVAPGCASLPHGPPQLAGEELRERASRPLWAVLGAAPRWKRQLDAGDIVGSAVAVADNTLLAACAAVTDPERVGLWRENKYRVGRVALRDTRGEVCVLGIPEGPVDPPRGYRSFQDLRVGEPVFALTNLDSVEVRLVEGRVLAKEWNGPRRFETSLRLPAGVRSAALFDGYGNFVGVSEGGRSRSHARGAVGLPVSAALAPKLARLDLGQPVGVAALATGLPATASLKPAPKPALLPKAKPERRGVLPLFAALRGFLTRGNRP